MLIGALSDTHGRLDTARAAVKLLRKRKAEYFIHCGDVGSEQILDLFAGFRAAFVWGNCDSDTYGLQRYAAIVGIQCCGAFGRLTLEGSTISLLHGDDHRRMQQILAEQDCDYLFSGHSHVKDMRDVGRIRLVNPGALHRAAIKTVALVDTATREVEFLTVE
jgi:uncharacterized protein